MFRARITELKEEGLLRETRPINSPHSARIMVSDRVMINFTSNSYLGLADDPRIVKAVARSVRTHGWGSGASRLMSGTSVIHEELEERLAAFKQTEAALLFGSGYLANIATIPAITAHGWNIFSDELNHASLIDACRLSKADVAVFPHRDMKKLSELLEGKQGQGLVVTDGVFSMDGHIAPLDAAYSLAVRNKAMLFVDDAHGTGIKGPSGRGSVAGFGLTGDNIIQMGTLSKALGGVGGFVAGSRDLINLLKSRGRAFIYTTALPATSCAASIEALNILESEGNELRGRLFANCRRLAGGLKTLGIESDPETPVFPIITGEIQRTLAISSRLDKAGIFAPAIRPPTVAPDKCRIRISLMAKHSEEDIDRLLSALSEEL